MSDHAIVGIAVAIALGAAVHPPMPLALVAALVIAAALALPRRPVLVALAGFALAALLAGRAHDGLALAMRPGAAVRGIATLVSDPIAVPGGTRADVRIDGHRFRATAQVPLDEGLRHAAAGERVRIAGVYRRFDDLTAARLAPRHLAGGLSIRDAKPHDRGNLLWRVANAMRNLVLDGATSLSPSRRALFAGMVLGDDRNQDPAEVEDFRAAGLTHLVAVSGQNVAFAMALAGPLLRRLSLRSRLAGAAVVLALFGTATRWEPSVTRAIAMAVVVAVASTLGRPATTVRVLAIATATLVLIDPLLVSSVGFQLSVAACAGIAVLAPRLSGRVAPPFAVTLAAQAGVAPILLPVFGPIPVASVPANALAAPVAAPLMMWGVVAGVPAGIAGGRVAWLLHLPTSAMLWWTSSVARAGASLPTGWVTFTLAAAALSVGLLGVTFQRWHPVVGRGLIALAAGMLIVAPMVGVIDAGDRAALRLDTGGRDVLWRRGGTTVVTSNGAAPPGRLLGALRVENVRSVDLLVVTGSSPAAARSVLPVIARLPVREIVAPPNHQVAGALAVEAPAVVKAGPFTVAVAPRAPTTAGGRFGLTVRIGSERAVLDRPP